MRHQTSTWLEIWYWKTQFFYLFGKRGFFNSKNRISCFHLFFFYIIMLTICVCEIYTEYLSSKYRFVRMFSCSKMKYFSHKLLNKMRQYCLQEENETFLAFPPCAMRNQMRVLWPKSDHKSDTLFPKKDIMNINVSIGNKFLHILLLYIYMTGKPLND